MIVKIAWIWFHRVCWNIFCKKMLKRQEYYEEEEMDDEAGRRQCGKW
jgi:hypothetical protein